VRTFPKKEKGVEGVRGEKEETLTHHGGGGEKNEPTRSARLIGRKVRGLGIGGEEQSEVVQFLGEKGLVEDLGKKKDPLSTFTNSEGIRAQRWVF